MMFGSPLTLSPTLRCSTASPTASTTPANSCPGISGGFTANAPESPSYICMSVPHTPQYFILIQTSSSLGFLSSTSSILISLGP